MTPGRRLLLLLVAFAAVALVEVRAAPLDAESCSNLEVERALLRLAGVEADMANGPDWAKANLAPQRVQEIGRLIELDEQLLFRCRATAAKDEDNDKEDKEAKAPPATKKPAATKSPTAKAKKPAKKAAARPAPASRKRDSGTAKAKPAATARKQPARKSGDDD